MLSDLIGVAGRKGVGKDTAIQQLVKEHGFNIVKFADPLKMMLRVHLVYCGVDTDTIERMVEGDLKEVPNEHLCGRTPRFFMQKLGTEFGRNMIGDDFWIRAFKAKARQHEKVAVTDVRFLNEEKAIEDLNGVVVRLVDPNFVAPENEHESESEIDSLQTILVFTNDRENVTIETLNQYLTSVHLVGWTDVNRPLEVRECLS